MGRESFRHRFHKSLNAWIAANDPLPLSDNTPLIAIADAVWLRFHDGWYTGFFVLLRPVDDTHAQIATLELLKGKESRELWSVVFHTIPDHIRENIVALVADGSNGLGSIAKANQWHFQRCHFHMKLKIEELRGQRNIIGRAIRHEAKRLIYRFLESKDDDEGKQFQQQLRALFRREDCPKSLPDRLGGIFRHGKHFRTYRIVPELNLPVTVNSAECVAGKIKEMWRILRGTKSPKAFCKWLMVLRRTMPPIKCLGWKETLQK